MDAVHVLNLNTFYSKSPPVTCDCTVIHNAAEIAKRKYLVYHEDYCNTYCVTFLSFFGVSNFHSWVSGLCFFNCLGSSFNLDNILPM